MNRFMLFGVTVGCLLAFTLVPLSARADDPGIRGKITQIRRETDQEKSIIGTVMVEADKKDAKSR